MKRERKGSEERGGVGRVGFAKYQGWKWLVRFGCAVATVLREGREVAR